MMGMACSLYKGGYFDTIHAHTLLFSTVRTHYSVQVVVIVVDHVRSAGSVYSWGMGTNLQLGTGEEDDEWSPVEMSGKQLEKRAVLAVSSGGQHTVLLVRDEQES